MGGASRGRRPERSRGSTRGPHHRGSRARARNATWVLQGCQHAVAVGMRDLHELGPGHGCAVVEGAIDAVSFNALCARYGNDCIGWSRSPARHRRAPGRDLARGRPGVAAATRTRPVVLRTGRSRHRSCPCSPERDHPCRRAARSLERCRLHGGRTNKTRGERGSTRSREVEGRCHAYPRPKRWTLNQRLPRPERRGSRCSRRTRGARGDELVQRPRTRRWPDARYATPAVREPTHGRRTLAGDASWWGGTGTARARGVAGLLCAPLRPGRPCSCSRSSSTPWACSRAPSRSSRTTCTSHADPVVEHLHGTTTRHRSARRRPARRFATCSTRAPALKALPFHWSRHRPTGSRTRRLRRSHATCAPCTRSTMGSPSCSWDFRLAQWPHGPGRTPSRASRERPTRAVQSPATTTPVVLHALIGVARKRALAHRTTRRGRHHVHASRARPGHGEGTGDVEYSP